MTGINTTPHPMGRWLFTQSVHHFLLRHKPTYLTWLDSCPLLNPGTKLTFRLLFRLVGLGKKKKRVQIRFLCRHLGMGERTVRRHVNALRDVGLITASDDHHAWGREMTIASHDSPDLFFPLGFYQHAASKGLRFVSNPAHLEGAETHWLEDPAAAHRLGLMHQLAVEIKQHETHVDILLLGDESFKLNPGDDTRRGVIHADMGSPFEGWL